MNYEPTDANTKREEQLQLPEMSAVDVGLPSFSDPDATSVLPSNAIAISVAGGGQPVFEVSCHKSSGARIGIDRKAKSRLEQAPPLLHDPGFNANARPSRVNDATFSSTNVTQGLSKSVGGIGKDPKRVHLKARPVTAIPRKMMMMNSLSEQSYAMNQRATEQIVSINSNGSVQGDYRYAAGAETRLSKLNAIDYSSLSIN